MPLFSSAQDLESFGKSKKFQFSGSLRLSSSFYQSHRIANRSSPFAYTISGSPVITLLGIRFPFSFSYRDQSLGITQPFQRYGVSPYYKWVKLHFGHRNLTFSPYTLAGRTFLGAGLELTPGKFHLSAMYGTLDNVTQQRDTLIAGANLLPSYKRRAYGAKIGYGDQSNHIYLMFFGAYDRVDMDTDTLSNLGIFPARNDVLGLDTKVSFFKRLSLGVNLAASSFTNNQESEQIDVSEYTNNEILHWLANLFDVNASTRLGFAGDLSLGLNFKHLNFGVKYKRVDPYFNSLGTYFIRNDYENISFNNSVSIAKGKLSVQGSFGLERNNLNGLSSKQTIRKILSLSANFRPNQYFGLRGYYNNFQSEQNSGFQQIDDTLRFIQVSRNVGLSPYLNLGSSNSRHNITISANYQQFGVTSNSEFADSDNQSLNGYFNYGLRFKEENLGVRIGFNLNQSMFREQLSRRYGATLGISKGFFENKMNVNLGATYNLRATDTGNSGYQFNLRLANNFRVANKHQFGISANWLKREDSNRPSFGEFRGQATYTFNW